MIMGNDLITLIQGMVHTHTQSQTIIERITCYTSYQLSMETPLGPEPCVHVGVKITPVVRRLEHRGQSKEHLTQATA